MARARKLKAEAIAEVFSRFQQASPEPMGELKSVNTYTLLVAVVLSAQATDAGVNKVTPQLFKVADTPEKMLALGEERLSQSIKSIGLYRTKAKNINALSKALIARHGSKVPASREELQALPGVGQDAARSRAGSRKISAGAIQGACSSLADPPWALCVQGAQTGMLALPHCRPVPLPAEDAGASDLKICVK